MEEKILTGKKQGMLVLLGELILYIALIAGCVAGGFMVENTGNPVLLVVCIILVCLAWIPLLGLKVLKPQEALVLTLFGKYVGTLKGDGFYFVNPFCVSVNPAAKTKLNQSGDVRNMANPVLAAQESQTVAEAILGEKQRFTNFSVVKMGVLEAPTLVTKDNEQIYCYSAMIIYRSK